MSDRARHVALGCAIAAALIATVALVGWAIGSETVTAIVPGRASMQVNAAVCGLVLAVGLVTIRRWVAGVGAAVVLVVVVATLLEYALGADLRIDQLVVHDARPGQNPPGRMAPVTAASFALLAVGRLQLARGSRRLVQALSLVPFAAGFLALLGYLVGVEQLHALARVDAVAVPTAVLLMILATGTLAGVRGGVLAQLVDGRDPGALLLRRMTPVALVLLPTMAYAVMRLDGAGLLDEQFGVALIVSCGAAVILAATVVAGRSLDRSVRREREARGELERLNAGLVAGRDAEWGRAETLARSLAQERAEFGRILATIDETVWSLRVSPEGLKALYMGSASPRLFGGPLPDDLNALQALVRLVHPDDRAVLDRFQAEVMACRPAGAEVRVVGFDGAERWAWVRGTPRDVDGGKVFDGITSDVTERRVAAEHREALLRLETARVEELREVARMRQDFVAVAGHELRSPLAAIMGHAELLQDDDDLSADQARQVEVIVRRSRQVGELVNDFFELARLEAGLSALDLEPLDLGAAADEAVTAYLPNATAAGLQLVASVGPVRVCGHDASMRRILDNLLSNAVKYTPAGGRVTVTVRRTGHTGVLVVTDTGIGIPARERTRVFDHLYRASTARANGVAGTGIGLAVTKALVDAQGGTIAVAAGPGGGTRFSVALPLVARPDTDPVDASAVDLARRADGSVTEPAAGR